jgi:Co/Zn/Cd efflux system component
MSTVNEYQSGYCNIGGEEKRLRRRFGYLGSIVTIVALIVIVGFRLDPILSLLLVFPIYGSVIGFYQDKSNFCVAFGFSGIYNMAEDTRDIKKIQDEIKRKTDRNRAIKMSLIASIISGVFTVAIYSVIFLIPL